ncbi:granzyme B-like [Gadus chalcogrammus]|uniref:granzyme B-like n=1 Tax=Gadus chalcogrammus TaxID=1042646 RepID=UPI0024C4BCEE|nr:granzyme B-like [Gadus chalcogrammus]
MFRLHTLLFIVLSCSVQKALGGEIINGKEVPPKSLQYMASVQNDGKHFCGGFLIKKDIVLTAAHCDKKTKTNVTVVLGTNDLRKDKKRTMRYNVEKCKHPGFINVLSGNDIMVLKLSRSSKMKPIKLPKNNTKIKNNTPCLVAGWGYNKTRGSTVDKLREVDVANIDRRKCQLEWAKVKKTLPANIICAGGYKTKKGACQGDSGGPLVCNKMAVGIVSFNLYDNCDYPNVPNVYTDIIKFLPWINDPKRKCNID